MDIKNNCNKEFLKNILIVFQKLNSLHTQSHCREREREREKKKHVGVVEEYYIMCIYIWEGKTEKRESSLELFLYFLLLSST